MDHRTYEIQVRLHLPRLSRADIAHRSPATVYDDIRAQALIRAAEICQSAEDAARRAHACVLFDVEKVRRDLSLSFTDGYRTTLLFGEVRPSAGHVVQSRLHYLRSERADTVLQFGLFLPGAAMPLTYVAFSRCDRRYVMDALAWHGLAARPEEILVLTRMHGLAGIPANLMSLTISRAVREIRTRNAGRYVITAYNPMLGFTGSSFRASGFTPMASAPVAYTYDERGLFHTRRISRSPVPQRLDTPNNILMILAVNAGDKQSVASIKGMAEIPRRDHSCGDPVPPAGVDFASPEWRERLTSYRRLLEAHWSSATVHPRCHEVHGSTREPGGQCGVASVWLTRKLQTDLLLDPTYCYGRLRFDRDDLDDVSHHCWVEIGRPSDPRRLVVDLTGDLAGDRAAGRQGAGDRGDGAAGPVVMGEHHALRSRGVRYEPVSRLRLDELPRDRVWLRFLALDDGLATAV
ncbi:hypothetical protein [Microbispora sp. NPDC049125]|uniref:Mom family adenine methylcarbamoylation protein n=1 Tax=Microbispora sp. NPDC049125 TaxID=3154929 RepID=UPI003466393E